MQINPVNNTNFNGLHASKSTLKKLGCSKDYFLRNPNIKECAEKYEVLVKTKKTNKTKPYDKVGTAVMATAAGIVGSLGGMLCVIHAGSNASFLPVLAGLILPPALCILGSHLYHSKTDYGFSLQGGKRITTNTLGQPELSGSLSKEYFIKQNSILSVPNLVEDIERNDYNKFFDIMDNHDSDDVIGILNDKKLKKEFTNGEYFNFPVDTNNNTLLTKFFDIIPTSENQNDYNKILNSMRDMKGINFDQKDSFGISVLEKILNSENFAALDLVRDFEFPYSPELDDAYNNIQNERFKLKTKNDLKIKFTHAYEALELDSPRALMAAIKEFDSPLCDKDREIQKLFYAYKDKVLSISSSHNVSDGIRIIMANLRNGRYE